MKGNGKNDSNIASKSYNYDENCKGDLNVSNIRIFCVENFGIISRELDG